MNSEILEPGRIRRIGLRKAGPGLVLAVVGHFYRVSMEDLSAATRREARTAFARQVVMYFLHVVYGMSLTEVAAALRRDRSTVSHACHHVEDMRDDPLLDRQLSQLERLLHDAAAIEGTP
jgi:chromosomal replication initiation ATPase DnaA